MSPLSPPKKLRDVLFARFALTAVVPVVLVSIAACVFLWRQEIRDAEWKNEMLAGSVARQVEVFLREPVNMLSHGRSTVVRYGGVGGGRAIDDALGILVGDSDLFEGLYVVDRTGKVVSVGLHPGAGSAPEELRGIDLSGNDFLMDVLRTGKTGWSDSWRPPGGGKSSIALCIPLAGGALFGNIDVAHFDRVSKSASAPGIGVAILDGRGIVISHSDPSLVGRSVNLRNIPLVSSGLTGADATGEYPLDGTRYLGSVAKVSGPGWLVLVSQRVDDAVAAVWKLLAIFLGGGMLAVATAVMLSRRQAESISRDFSDLTEQAGRIADGEYEIDMGASGLVEVRRLADSIQDMAVAVGEREIRLRDSLDRYQVLFNGNVDALFIYDIGEDGRYGRFIEVNDAACRMLGRSRDELMGMTPYDVAAPARVEGIEQRAQGLRETGSLRRETEVVTRDGRLIPVDIRSRRFELEGKVAVFSVLRDLTELKKATREKEELEAKLRRAQKLEAVGTLAGGVAHDFNNLLQVISGYTVMALNRLPPDGTVFSNLMQVQGAANRAAELVQRLLAFSRKENPRKRIFNLSSELESSVRLLEFTIPKMIDIRLSIAPGLSEIDGDPTQIGQVVVNLCTNARDAMPGGGTLSIAAFNVEVVQSDPIRPVDCRPGRYVAIRVEDSGVGMDDQTIAKIFDPFFTTKEVGKGTGLGLSIVYGIVKTHGGWTTCESAPGKGTAFTVYLPAASGNGDDEPSGGSRTVAAAPEAAARPKGRVLVADDDDAVRDLSVSILEGKGFTVDAAKSGEEALERFDAPGAGYDLVVLDLGMPGMGGAKCLELLREKSPDVRVIVASGFIPDEQAASLRRLGATVITKPYGIGAFEETVGRVIGATATP
jgi:PAS domain S-box-containing protein